MKVVDPRRLDYAGHRRRPSLVLPLPDGMAVFMPQVGVDLGRMKLILDHLVGVSCYRYVTWFNIEVDGPPERDYPGYSVTTQIGTGGSTQDRT